MTKLHAVCQFLESFAPLRLAEDWDNVGLLVGDRAVDIERVMTCLTITPDSVAEAVERSVHLIVTHHPLPFRSTKRITTDSTAGKMLWDLIGKQVAIYSPHTAFDSATLGINQQLAQALRLTGIEPLRPFDDDPDALGSGRMGKLADKEPVSAVADRLKKFLALDSVRITGKASKAVKKIGVGCGSGGEFLATAKRAGCDMFVTGEANFHSCLEAEAADICLLLVGHFASERFAVEQLAQRILGEFSDLEVWPSQREHPPLTAI